jgi:hypothetical protein
MAKLSAEQIKESLRNGLAMDEAAIRSELTRIGSQLGSMSLTQLENQINDSDRVRHYKNAQWTSSEIELARCWVWPTMGKISWATGKLSEVTRKLAMPSQFPLMPDKRIKFDSIATNLATILSTLPIIVFIQEGVDYPGLHPDYDGQRKESEYDIDDGCHRAIMACQANCRTIPALVGKLPKRFR